MRKLIVLTMTIGLAQGLSAIATDHNATTISKTDSETVIVTYRVKEGKESDFLHILGQQWPTLRKLGLVEPQPHLVMRGEDESKKTYFVEILTWKSHEAPDNAPPEVRAIWAAMQTLVEDRLGHRGIEFPEVHIVQLAEK